jgi:hypothetical protein
LTSCFQAAVEDSEGWPSNGSNCSAGRLADLLKILFPSGAAWGLRLLAGGHNVCWATGHPWHRREEFAEKKISPKNTFRAGGLAARGVKSRLFFAARAANPASI